MLLAGCRFLHIIYFILSVHIIFEGGGDILRWSVLYGVLDPFTDHPYGCIFFSVSVFTAIKLL